MLVRNSLHLLDDFKNHLNIKKEDPIGDEFSNASTADDTVRNFVQKKESGDLSLKDLMFAPPSFFIGEHRAVYVDIQNVEVTTELNLIRQRMHLEAEVSFAQQEKGAPIIFLKQTPTGIWVNDKPILPDAFITKVDPDGMTELTLLDHVLEPGVHKVRFEYQVAPDDSDRIEYERNVSKPANNFDTDNFRFFQRAGDASFIYLGFSEEFFPSSPYQGDQYSQSNFIRVVGADEDVMVVSSGDVVQNDKGWLVSYPSKMTINGQFLDIVPKNDFTFRKAVYHGLAGEVPVTVYGKDSTSVEKGLKLTLETLDRFEGKLGAYPHSKLVVLIDDEMNAGLEYMGATITNLRALVHELLHQWIGRSVLPANGNATYIDEAGVTWAVEMKEMSMAFATLLKIAKGEAKPVNITSYSPYSRDTRQEAYKQGPMMMAALDSELKELGGAWAILRELYENYRDRPITHEGFKELVLNFAPDHKDVIEEIFDTFVHPEAGSAVEQSV